MPRHARARVPITEGSRPAGWQRALRILLSSLLLTGGLTAYSSVHPREALAAGSPFSCQSEFFQVLSGQLVAVDPANQSFVNIGSASADSYNALAMNDIGGASGSGYLYAMAQGSAGSPYTKGDLLQIDSSGSVTDLGAPTGGYIAGGYNTGAADDNGNEWILSNGSATVQRISLTAPYSATPMTETSAPFTLSQDTGAFTLSAALTSGVAPTKLTVNPLTFAVTAGDLLTVTSGANTQTFTAKAAAVGATTINLNAAPPANFSYPVGTAGVDANPKVSTLSVNALPYPIATGDTLILSQGANSDTVSVSGSDVAVGATTITVNAKRLSFAYTAGATGTEAFNANDMVNQVRHFTINPEAFSLTSPLSTQSLTLSSGLSTGLFNLSSSLDNFTLSASLNSAGGPITSLPVNALAFAVSNGDSVKLVDGASSQTFTASGPAGVGATSIPVNSQTPNFSYTTGPTTGTDGGGTVSTLPVDALTFSVSNGEALTLADGGNTDTFTAAASAAVGATAITVIPKIPNFLYPFDGTQGSEPTASMPVTSIPVTATGFPIASGEDIWISDGPLSQRFVVTASALAGATSITVAAQTPNFNYPAGAGSTAVTGATVSSLAVAPLGFPVAQGDKITLANGSNSETFLASAAAVAGDTSISVAPQSPNFAYPIAGTVGEEGAGTLSTSSAITSLAVAPLTYAVSTGDSLWLSDNGTSQQFVATAPAAVGATAVSVASQTPGFAYQSANTLGGDPSSIFYGINNNILYSLNIATSPPTVSSTLIAGFAGETSKPGFSVSFGGGWTDAEGDLFFYNNGTGDFVQIANPTTAPAGYVVDAGFAGNGSNDAASCDFAPSPFIAPALQTPQAYVTTEGTPLGEPAGTLLANDTGDSVTITSNTNGAHDSSLVVNADGSFTYTPTGGYFGSDSFTVQGTDKWGQKTNTAVITINVRESTTIATVSPSVNPVVAGNPVTYTATVAPSAGGTPTGQVEFTDNGTPIAACGGTSGNPLNASSPDTATCAVTYPDNTGAPHAILANYLGDATFGPSTSASFNEGVMQPTTTALGTSATPVDNGVAVTYTATVARTAGVGTPSQNVEFLDGGTPIAACNGSTGQPLNGANPDQVACTVTYATGAAVHTITATYLGDSAFLTSTSSPLSETVLQTTTTTLGSSLNPTTTGTAVTYTATVAPTAGGGTPTGAVQFTDNGSPIAACGGGTGNVALNGASPDVATCTVSYSSTVGSPHPIVAVYSGDTNFDTSTSSTLNEVVNGAAASFTASAVAPSIPYGTASALTESGLPGGATGTVTYTSGLATLCIETLPATSCNTATTLAPGTYPITAAYSGDSTYAGSTASTSLTVTKAPLTITASSTSTVYGTTPTVTASYSGFVNSDNAASLTTAPSCSSMVTPSSPVSGSPYNGANTCSGAASPDYNFTYVAGNATVTQASTAFTASAVPPSVVYGNSSALTESGLAGDATGTVTYTSGASTLCIATLPATSCATSTSLPVGTYAITATYSGDGNYTGSTASTSLTVTVASTSFTASAVPSTVSYGSSSALTETGITGAATGTVTYTSGASTLCVETLPATSCATATTLSPGGYAITATYSGDANNAGATANTSLTVTKAPLTITASNTSTPHGTIPSVVPLFSGFVNGDSVANLTTAPSCTTTVTTATPASGSAYTGANTCSGAASPNYTFIYVAGDATVTQAATPFTASATPTPVTYGTASSLAEAGLPSDATGTVTFTSGATLCVATLPTTSCPTVTSLPAGSYPITATYSGDSNYVGSTAGTNLVVDQAPLTVTASNSSSSYGTTPTVTPQYSGFVNGESASNLTTAPSCASTVAATSPVAGSPYNGANSCGGAVDSNYSFSYVAGDATVTPAGLTVTASNSSSSYGTSPTVTPQYSGFVNGESASALTTAPSCVSTVTATSPVGGSPYNGANRCSGAIDSNYSFSYVAGDATVTPAALTVTASNTSTSYGTTPTVTPQYSGFVNGESASNLTTAPSCVSTVTATSPVGGSPYNGANSCSGAVDSNYSFTYVAGDATVTPAALTVTASNSSSSYGTSPTVTPQYSGFVNGESASALTTAPSCVSTVTATSPVSGSPYNGANSCSGAVDSNYNFSYVAGNATITPAALTITASNTSSPHGTIPTVKPLYSGLVNGESASNLTTAPSCSSTVTAGSSVAGSPYNGANSCSGAVDSNYAISYVTGVATVVKATPALDASATPPSVPHGTSSTLAILGMPSDATGTVTFTSGSTTLCTATLPATTCTTSTTLPVGSYPITATYPGDANYNAGSASTNLTVTIFATSFTAAATPPNIVYGTKSSLSVTGIPAPATGTVTFTSGTTTLCVATLPATSCSTSTTLPVATYPITATYSGDATYASSTATTALTVTPAPTTVTVISSQNPVVPNQPITYTATVGPDPGSGTVTFTDNEVSIPGCVAVPIDPATGVAVCHTTYPATGTHTIAATFNGNNNFSVSSAPTSGVFALVETVQKAVTVPQTGWATALGLTSAATLVKGALLLLSGLLALAWSRRRQTR